MIAKEEVIMKSQDPTTIVQKLKEMELAAAAAAQTMPGQGKPKK
jgi:hypothetical protein